MATLREITHKLHSIENVQKITQAMEMVAGVRLRRAHAQLDHARLYAQKLKDILDNLLSTSNLHHHPLLVKKDVQKIGVVIIAGDRGLCGSYNNSIFSSADKFLKEHNNSELMLLGHKAITYFSEKRWKIAHSVSDWGGKITYPQIEALSRLLIQQYTTGIFDEIWFIYSHFASMSSRITRIEKFLGIERVARGQDGFKQAREYIYEPSAEAIIADVLSRYCTSKVLSALNEAYASELAARVIAMRAATKNAEKMSLELTLLRNRTRQTSITRELIEITSSTDALK